MDDLEQRCLAALRARHNRMEPCDDESLVRAIIPMVLEHAAKVAEEYDGPGMNYDMHSQLGDASRTASDIAAAIRAIGAP